MIDFRALRFDEAHHLGLGDIRLTIGQQEEIDAEISALRTSKESLMVGRDFLMAEIDRLREALQAIYDLPGCRMDEADLIAERALEAG